MRILVADDDPMSHRILNKLLKELPLDDPEIVFASSIREALDLFVKVRPNIVISDLVFPGGVVQGGEFAAWVKAKGVPVLIVSSSADLAPRGFAAANKWEVRPILAALATLTGAALGIGAFSPSPTPAHVG